PDACFVVEGFGKSWRLGVDLRCDPIHGPRVMQRHVDNASRETANLEVKGSREGSDARVILYQHEVVRSLTAEYGAGAFEHQAHGMVSGMRSGAQGDSASGAGH